MQEGITEREQGCTFHPTPSPRTGVCLLENKTNQKREREEKPRGHSPVGVSRNAQILKPSNPYTAEEGKEQLHPGTGTIRSLPTHGLDKILAPGNALPPSWGRFLPTHRGHQPGWNDPAGSGKDPGGSGKDPAAPALILLPTAGGQANPEGSSARDRRCQGQAVPHGHPSSSLQQVALGASCTSKMFHFSSDTGWGQPKAHLTS